MTDANIQLEFRIITDETSDKTKTPEEFQDFLDEKITNLELASDSFIAYVIDNMNDTESANRAILLRYNGGETQIFYNSIDVFLKSRSKSDLATASDNGLMSSHDHALLKNLDANLNTDEATSIITSTNEIIKDIIEVDKDATVSDKNKIYKFKDKKISTIDKINNKLSELEELLNEIWNFINPENNELMYTHSSIQDYINELIKNSEQSIVNDYINHTHQNQ